MKRGEIYYADLGHNQGSEQSGIRLVCIVQNDVGNKYSPTTIICPLTSQTKNILPTHVFISGTPKVSTILCEQIRVLSTKKIASEKIIYTLNEEEIKELNKAISISVGLEL